MTMDRPNLEAIEQRAKAPSDEFLLSARKDVQELVAYIRYLESLNWYSFSE